MNQDSLQFPRKEMTVPYTRAAAGGQVWPGVTSVFEDLRPVPERFAEREGMRKRKRKESR